MPTIETTINAVNAARLAPGWFTTLSQRVNRGESHIALLDGNIFDFVYPGWTVEDWLKGQFGGTDERPRRDVVMTIGQEGISFGTEHMRRLFEATMGLELPSDPDERALLTTTDMWTTQRPNDVPLPTEPSAMLRLALDFLKKARYANPDDPYSGPVVPGGARSAALIVPRIDLIVPACDKYLLSPDRLRIVEMLEIASTDPSIEDAQNLIVLMSPSRSDVFNDVRRASGLRLIRVPLPDYAERLQFIGDLIDMKPWMVMAISAEELATLTAGQNCRDIEDITLRAGDQPLTRQIALERGGELIDARYGGVMQRLNPTFGFDGIGGNVALKDFLQRKVISRIRRGITRGVPMGMLLAGPPGVGKSVLAMAAAFEAGINAIEIKNLKDKWLGNSEKNLEEMIEGAEMFAPTFLFMDEYDKIFGSGGENDHPVDAAMQKRLQEWLAMESHRGRIFLMAAANHPDRVPPAMMRTGRIDVKAPMLAPETEEERIDILSRLLVRYGQPDVPFAALIEFGAPTNGWVGSDLEFAVSQAVGDVADDPDISLIDALREAIDNCIPADNAAIRAQETAALRACNVLSLLPQKERLRRKQKRVDGEDRPAL